MKAIIYTKYGPPDVLQFKDVPKPSPKEDEALVAVQAASVNYGDSALVAGKPFLVRLMGYGLFTPKYATPGTDIAGIIEEVGGAVTRFQSGDEVFADVSECGFGAFAEFAAVPETDLALKPANISFEEAAAVPQAAVVALQGLRDKGQIQTGDKVLINGASGGVGTFAIQIAKSFGAEVTGVCSAKNLDLLRSIGADQVIDYTKEDFTEHEGRYDLIFDIVANRSMSDYMRALSPTGRYVACAFNPSSLFFGSFLSKKGGKQASSLNHKPKVEDLHLMKDLLESGQVSPVIDKSYPLGDLAEAMRYLAEGQGRGKVVITMNHKID